MKNTPLKFTLAVLVSASVLFSQGALSAQKTAVPLAAPTGVQVGGCGGGEYNVSWNAVGGASKYSVDVILSVDTDDDDIADTTVTISYGSDTNSATVLAADIDAAVSALDNPDLGFEAALIGVPQVKVKGLNPPGKSQNHPFSEPIDLAC
jgi:hypothetical protein